MKIEQLIEEIIKGKLSTRDFVGSPYVPESVAIQLAERLRECLNVIREEYEEELKQIPISRNYPRLDKFGKLL